MIGNGLERLATEIHEIIARIPVRRHRTQITVLHTFTALLLQPARASHTAYLLHVLDTAITGVVSYTTVY